MAQGENTITFGGDAAPIKAAATEATQAIKSVEDASKTLGDVSVGTGEKSAGAVSSLATALNEVKPAATSATDAIGDVASVATISTGRFDALGKGLKNLLGATGLGSVAQVGGKAVEVLKGLATAAGPLGAALAVVAGAAFFLKNKFDENAESTRKLEEEYDKARASAEKLATEIANTGGAFPLDKQLDELKTLEEAQLKALEARLKNEGWTQDAINKAIETKKQESSDRLAAIDADLVKKAKDAEDNAATDRYTKAVETNKKLQDAIRAEGLIGIDKLKNEEESAIEELTAKRLAEHDEVIAQEIEASIEATQKLFAIRRENAQKAIDDENTRKAEQIKKDADARMKAEMEADRKIHEERLRQLAELRDERSGDLGGIGFFNSGREAVWMNGGGGR